MLVLAPTLGAAVEATAARRVPSARDETPDREWWRSREPRPGASRGIHLGGVQRPRDRRPLRRAHERDARPPPQGGRRARVRGVLDAREVLARGVPRVRRRSRSRAWAPAVRHTGACAHRTDASVTRHAHGWMPQTLADFGILGLPSSHALGLAWLLAALSSADLLPRRLMRATRGDDDREPPPRRDWDKRAHRDRSTAIVPIVFAVQSLVDWTWFIEPPRWRCWGRLRGRRDPRLALEQPQAEPIPVAAERIASPPRSSRSCPAACSPGRSGCRRRPTGPRTTRSRLASSTIRAGARADERRGGPEPADPRPAAGARGDRHDGRARGRRAPSLERAVIQFPGDPRPGTGSPPSSSGRSTLPSRRSRRSRGSSTSTRSRVGTGSVPSSARAAPREDGRGSARRHRVA